MIPNNKTILLLLAITVAVLCTLPFLVKDRDILYIYAKTLNADENAFLSALETNGFKLKKNPENMPKNAYALWFYPPEQAFALQNTALKQTDFIYSEAYYPFDWHGLKKLPVMLTPHQKLYEHYMRTNIKSAVLDIKTPAAAAVRFKEIYHWLKANR